jgi:hypothetical protein
MTLLPIYQPQKQNLSLKYLPKPTSMTAKTPQKAKKTAIIWFINYKNSSFVSS